MPSMGCPDTALLVFRWHFRDEGMALYPPKVPSERVEEAMPCSRRRPLFDPKMTFRVHNVPLLCVQVALDAALRSFLELFMEDIDGLDALVGG